MERTIEVLVSARRPAVLDLPVTRRGTIGGIVEDIVGDALLEGVTVRLWGSHGNLVAAATTDASGQYKFDDVKPGPQLVSVDIPLGYVCEDPERLVDMAPDGTFEVDFTLRRAGIVRGRVVDEDTGEPVPNATVELFDSLGRRVVTGRTLESGDYEFVNLPEDKYMVRVVPEPPSRPR